jgi:hypothetical protein
LGIAPAEIKAILDHAEQISRVWVLQNKFQEEKKLKLELS